MASKADAYPIPHPLGQWQRLSLLRKKLIGMLTGAFRKGGGAQDCNS